MKAEEWYSGIAEGYNELYAIEQKEKLAIIAKHIRLDSSSLLLDLGCGTGISRQFFKCRIVGVDPAVQLLQQSNLKKVCGIAEKLPFRSSSFDAAICVTAIHNFNNAAAVSEIKRVCKGDVAVTVLKKAASSEKICLLIRKAFPSAVELDSGKDTIFIYGG